MTERVRREGDRGAVLFIVALSLAFLVTATAFTIDLGRLMMRERDVQAVADLVSLDLVRSINGRSVQTLQSASDWALEEQQSAARNNFDSSKLIVTLGHLDSSNQFVQDSGSTVPTAVKVEAVDTVDFFFAPGSHTADRTAIATQSGTLDYTSGSFLAGASPSTTQVALLNRVLTVALGKTGAINLDAVSYQGLASATVSARQIATQMGLASPDQLFSGTVKAKQYELAMANAVQANGGPAAAVTALNTIAAQMDNSTNLDVNKVEDPTNAHVSQGGLDGFDSQFSVLGAITGSAFAINGSNAISVPGLSFSVPGFGTVDTTLTVIQHAVFYPNQYVGQSETTSQLSMSVTANINLDLSTVPGISGLSAITNPKLSGTITVVPNAGSATTTVAAISCGTASAPAKSADISAAASPVSTTASESLTLSGSVVLLGQLNLLQTNVTNATISATGSSQTGHYNYTADFGSPAGSAGAQRLASNSLTLSPLHATSANSTVLGGALPLATLASAVNQALDVSLLPSLQNTILPTITQTLGLELGGADVTANQMYCNGARLAG